MTDYAKPATAPVWGESNTTAADMVRPTDDQIKAGWPLSNLPPARQRFNWLINWVFQGTKYLFQRGVADWSADEFYRVGSRVIGDDGRTYVSLQAGNTGHQPSTSPAWWDCWGATPAQSSLLTFGADTGVANAYVVAITPAPQAYYNGMTVKFIALNSNTGASTLNVGPGNKSLKTGQNAALQAGDVAAGSIYTAVYSSVLDAFLMASPVLSQLQGIVPPGQLGYFATASAPAGWLVANGAAISRTTYAALFKAMVTDSGFTAQTFVVNLATPATFTKAGHGFLGGERLRLFTTGSLPTGITTGTDYFVIYVDANTFRLAANSPNQQAGVAIATSGAQSGVHTYLQSLYGLGDGATTFLLPELRGEHVRSHDQGRGVNASQANGAWAQDTMQTHAHASVVDANHPYAAGSTINDFAGAAIAIGTAAASAVGAPTTFGQGTPRVGAETKPRGVAMLACIKT
ncbi:MAG: tail fiber protein [Nevskiaceae bacterium]|nr:MAG: tail fiber protein [Nevskiaceae bacterium]